MNALEIRNLQKSFGSHVVLDNLTMTVREGEVLVSSDRTAQARRRR